MVAKHWIDTSKRRPSLASTGIERENAPTRMEIFLAEMDEIIPWKEMCALIEASIPSLRALAGVRSALK